MAKLTSTFVRKTNNQIESFTQTFNNLEIWKEISHVLGPTEYFVKIIDLIKASEWVFLHQQLIQLIIMWSNLKEMGMTTKLPKQKRKKEKKHTLQKAHILFFFFHCDNFFF